MQHHADGIRNVALVGHRGSGKTSLNEALLFEAGVLDAARERHRRHERLRRRSRRAGPADVDFRVARVLRVGRAQDQPDRHAGRAELHRRRARRAARLRVGGLRPQRGDGRRGDDDAPVEGRGPARHRPVALRQHARPRARRLLPHARLAQDRLRPARRRHADPDRQRARGLAASSTSSTCAPTRTRRLVAGTRRRSRSPRTCAPAPRSTARS